MRQTLEEHPETTFSTQFHSLEQTTERKEAEALSVIPQERLLLRIRMQQVAAVAVLLHPDQQSPGLVSILNFKPQSRVSGLQTSRAVFGFLEALLTHQLLLRIHPRISAGRILPGFPVSEVVAEPQSQIAVVTDIVETAAAVAEAFETEEPQVSAATAGLDIAELRHTHESRTSHRISR